MRRVLWTLAATGVACCFAVRPAVAQPTPPEFASPRTSISVGAIPHSIAVGDFNQDGRPDLAISNRGNSTISLLIQGPGRQFSSLPAIGAPGEPYSIATADLDLDGHLDLVTGGFSLDHVSVFRGLGNGSFDPPVHYPGHGHVLSVALHDMNGDQYPDLVTGNWSTGSASLFLNQGNGQFGGRLDIPTAGQVWAVAVGDLDENGIPDFVTANEAASNVSVVRGLGNGQFLAPVNYAVASSPRGLAVSDVTGDGHLDIVAQNGSGSVSVLPGNGTGTFTLAPQIGQGSFAFGLAVGDLNRDGLPDIASAQSGMSSVSFLLGEGGGSFVYSPGLSPFNAPRAVAISDLDGDHGDDLIVTEGGSNFTTIYFNLAGGTRGPSATVLDVSPSPSLHGQEVALVATVTPASATGTVTFRSGPAVLGSAPLSNGEATLPVSGLAAGTHSLTATYGGDQDLLGSSSNTVTHEVLKSPVSVLVISTPNPSEQHTPATFTVTVSPAPGGNQIPTGNARLRFDQNGLGIAKPLVDGQATFVTDTLPPGDHLVEALYDPAVPSNFAPGAAQPITHTVESSEPRIVQVVDVPRDQGGRVFVKWRCTLDKPGNHIVTAYRVWRRIPEIAFRKGDSKFLMRPVGSPGATAETFWEFLTQVPAAQLISYGYTSTTFFDSTATDNPYTAFFVQALTTDPFAWFDSPVDSGYSVDNLAPAAPLGASGVLAAGGAALRWNRSKEADLREYRVHVGDVPDFEPTPENLLASLPDTVYTDPTLTLRYYRIAAVDVHDNVSEHVTVIPTSLLDAPGSSAVALALRGAAPNPARGDAVTVTLSLPEAAAGARLDVLDVSGRRVWSERLDALGPGTHQVRLKPQKAFPAGLYLLRLQHGGRELKGRFTVVE